MYHNGTYHASRFYATSKPYSAAAIARVHRNGTAAHGACSRLYIAMLLLHWHNICFFLLFKGRKQDAT